MRGRWCAVTVLAALAAGCSSPIVEDDLEGKLKRYYALHAVEEEGRCPEPEIGTITRRKVQESAAAQSVLRVRYSYFDPSVEEETDWRHVLIGERPCTGFAERDFTLVKRRTGYAVLEMSGARRVAE